MTNPLGYRTGVALWSAATARARATGTDANAVIRRFIFERFLARVFADLDAPWVLKGGTAVLARVQGARTTKDVDLLGQLSSLDAAVEALRAASALDLGDHFRFVITNVGNTVDGAGQPAVDGCRVGIDGYCGAVKKDSFSVDIVTGSLMTMEPELRTDTVLDLPGVKEPTLRLYPVVDHIADKLCATQAMYGPDGTRGSSRVRDLVDLVVLAGTQDVEGSALVTAVRGEWAHRRLPGEPTFAPPPAWERLYPPLARRVPACAGTTSFADAVVFVGSFLAPVLNGEAAGRHWSSSERAWR